MKKQVFYIHGGSAFSKYENFLEHIRTTEVDPFAEKPLRWTQSLSTVLKEQYEIIAPSMPNSQNAKYPEWKIWFERHFEFLSGETILLGWSLGGLFLAKYLCENPFPVNIDALLLVAPVFGDGTVSNEIGEDDGDFKFESSDVPKIAEQVSNIHIFHSKDDFVVPYEHAVKYKEKLPNATLHTFEDKNHFLIEEFPEIIECIRQI